MSKKKWFRALSSTALGILIASSLTVNAHAAVTSYIATDSTDSSKIISFSADKLIADYTNNMLGKASPMYNEYLKDATNLLAFQDSVKGYVSADPVEKAYTNALINNDTTFTVDNFTENASSADILNITVGYICNQDGLVVSAPESLPTATIESVGTEILGKTVVIASLPQGVDMTKYDVTVNGTKLTYDSSSGKFTGTIDGTYTKEQLQSNTTVSLIGNNTSDEFDVSEIY